MYHYWKVAADLLNRRARPRLLIARSAKDLLRLARRKLEQPASLHLEQRSTARDVLALPPILTGIDMVRKLLEPGLVSLDATRHLSKLAAADLVVDNGLAKRLAEHGVVKRHCHAGPRRAVALHSQDEALAVEILHDDGKPHAFFPDEVLNRNTHVVEVDERGATGIVSAVINLFNCNTGRVHRCNQNRYSSNALATAAYGRGHVRSPG